jgi:hypothetical protein
MKPAILTPGAVEDVAVPGQNFWLCLKALSAAFDGKDSEAVLDDLEHDLMRRHPAELAPIREEIHVVVGHLSRLELRLKQHHKETLRGVATRFFSSERPTY